MVRDGRRANVRKLIKRDRENEEKWYDSIVQTNLTIIDSDSDGERERKKTTRSTQFMPSDKRSKRKKKY